MTHWADHEGYAERQDRSLTALRRSFAGDGSVSSADVAAFEAHVNLYLVVPS